MIESEVIAALDRLNPVIAEKPDAFEESSPSCGVILSVIDDGLDPTNEAHDELASRPEAAPVHRHAAALPVR